MMGGERDEDRGVPCCAADAARRVKRVMVGPNLVGIMELDRIIGEVHGSEPGDDDEARDQLLGLAKVYNHIPPKAEEAYAEALLAEYRKRHPEEEGT